MHILCYGRLSRAHCVNPFRWLGDYMRVSIHSSKTRFLSVADSAGEIAWRLAGVSVGDRSAARPFVRAQCG